MSAKLNLLITISITAFVSTTNAVCTAPGFKCDGCWTSTFCIDIGNNEFIEDRQDCTLGTSCQKSTGICSGNGNYECDGTALPFNCHGIGAFPDPYNCDIYHICLQNGISQGSERCPEDYGFDAFTGRCSNKIENPVKCTSSVPICTTAGQTGPLTDYPGYFYRCSLQSSRYVPEIYTCLTNNIFNGAMCVDPTPKVVDELGRCLEKGLFFYPGDCHRYRDCGSVGAAPIARTCSSNNKFDPIQQKCVPYSCSNYYL